MNGGRETHGAVVLPSAPLELRDAVSRGHRLAGAFTGRPPRHVVLQRPVDCLRAATLWRRGHWWRVVALACALCTPPSFAPPH